MDKKFDAIDLSMQNYARIDSRFKVIHDGLDPDRLRVEIDNHSTRTTTVVNFLLSDIQKAIREALQSPEKNAE